MDQSIWSDSYGIVMSWIANAAIALNLDYCGHGGSIDSLIARLRRRTADRFGPSPFFSGAISQVYKSLIVILICYPHLPLIRVYGLSPQPQFLHILWVSGTRAISWSFAHWRVLQIYAATYFRHLINTLVYVRQFGLKTRCFTQKTRKPFHADLSNWHSAEYSRAGS